MKNKSKNKFHDRLPGMRVLKTFIAILLCVSIDYLRGASSPFQSSIATVICLQPTLASSYETSKARIFGTIVSGIFTASILIPLRNYGINFSSYTFYFIIAVSSLVLMSFFVFIDKKKSLSIGVIVFLVIAFTNNQSDPLPYTITRVIDTLIGIGISILINWFPYFNVNNPDVVKDEVRLSNSVTIKANSLVYKMNDREVKNRKKD